MQWSELWGGLVLVWGESEPKGEREEQPSTRRFACGVRTPAARHRRIANILGVQRGIEVFIILLDSDKRVSSLSLFSIFVRWTCIFFLDFLGISHTKRVSRGTRHVHVINFVFGVGRYFGGIIVFYFKVYSDISVDEHKLSLKIYLVFNAMVFRIIHLWLDLRFTRIFSLDSQDIFVW